tara:strand:+ start:123 stop:428 length:306 start_codon:yes stop_codon:yes gene_type:complete
MAFGQFGNAFADTAAASITPPTGQVIVCIQMLSNTAFDVLTPENEEKCFGITSSTHGAGSGGVTVATNNIFGAGLTIYGRWKAVSLNAAQATGGIICYFGE